MRSTIGVLSLLFLVCAADKGAGSAAWRASLAGADEPGEKLVVNGVVKDVGGRPIAGASVYLYHTDARGVYNDSDGSSQRPRLKANLTTDAHGRYEVTTIKPGSYPGTRNPAHIHLVADSPRHREREVEIVFEGDPFVTPEMRRSDGFFVVVPLQKDRDGTLRCSYDIVLER